MEKFAVDLEKVLDEFEYNEEREENVPSSLMKSSPLPNIASARTQVPIRPPAASYRRPSFEPINLADADFAASPPKTSTSNLKLGISSRTVDNGTFSLSSSGPEVNNRNLFNNRNDNGVSCQDNEVNINKQIILESEDVSSNNVWKLHPSIQTDEKPDLLEYNSKIDGDLVSCALEIQNQLPDLTSVRASNLGANNSQVDSVSNSLDLISSTSGTLLPSIETEGASGNLESSPEALDAENVEEIYNIDSPIAEQRDSELLSIETEPKDSSLHTEERFDSITTEKQKPNTNFSSNYETPIEVPLNEQNTTDGIIRSQLEFDGQENSLNLCKQEETNLVSDQFGNSYLKEHEDTSDSTQYFESQKPIGFSADSDVSESDLEEYLKELEELDKTLAVEQESSNIQSIKSMECDRTVVQNESKSLNELSEEVRSPDALIPETICLSNNNKTRTESLECEVESCERINSNLMKEELSNSASENCNLSEDSKKIEHLQNLIKNNLEQDESTIQKDISQKTFESETTAIMVLPHAVEINSETIEATCIASNVYKPSEPKSTNPFDEDDEVEKEIHCEKRITNSLKKENLEHFKSKEIAQNESNSDQCKVENTNQVEEDIKVSVSALNKFTQDPEKSKFDLNQTTTEEFITTHSNGDESGLTSVVKGDSSLDNLPSCSSQQSGTLEGSVRMIPIKSASESPSTENVDEAGVVADEERPSRPNSLELPQRITVDATSPQSPERPTGELVTELGGEDRRLGKIPPFWVPDTEANQCMQCQLKFTVIKRRHHCRACGQVLCYKCCGLKARLEYMNFADARVCQPCFTILEAVRAAESSNPLGRQPNPNNPMEYCSTIPPLQQAAGSMHQPPPSVMVPVGVLKREGRVKSEVTKQVMFSDGIRPGGDLTELDGSGEPRMPFRRPGRLTKRVGTPPGGMLSPTMRRVMDPTTHSFIPAEGDALPPVVTRLQAEVSYSDLESPISLGQPSVKFAINRNLFVSVQRVMLDCCLNRESWCFCSEGLACVGQDEIVFLLECLPQEILPPKDVFFLINSLYQDAAKGSTVAEMSFTPTASNTLLGSRDHGGFLYIRTSYQCTAQLSLPPPPYLVALLIHRWETPWARLFPLRLVLRLGAEFRYYPCPLVSVRNRPPLYTDIGHTIINILADFRKYSYTLPSVRGLVIHMEDRQTTINIPKNRYDQVVRALNNSNDSVLAFGANLSLAADSHLVCMQSSEDENTSYHTQAINIHNKPRKVTGASFVVFNGALKVPGLAGKSNIVEDGLMVQVPGETMTALRTALRDMRDYTVGCGPNAEETVVLQWTADDTNFNIGVKSCIDGKALDGVPSIRVHNGTDYSGGTRIIRWTEVFILQCEDFEQTTEPVDVSRVSERIARATCVALVQLLDLLTAAGLTTLAVRATIHPDNVGYEAGSCGEKLPPLYMKSLDNELVAVVHQAALSSQENPAVLELVFRVMEQG